MTGVQRLLIWLLPPHMQSLPHNQHHSPEWYFFFYTKDELNLTHHRHPMSVVYLRVPSRCVHSESLYKYLIICSHHRVWIIQSIAFTDLLVSLSNKPLRFLCVFSWLDFILALNNIPRSLLLCIAFVSVGLFIALYSVSLTYLSFLSPISHVLITIVALEYILMLLSFIPPTLFFIILLKFSRICSDVISFFAGIGILCPFFSP